MLRLIKIENFQSLKKVSLELGKLTVVVGPSSSGKTALLRALGLLAFNARGTSYISRGASICQVAVSDENYFALIQRGARGKDKYAIGTVVEPYAETEFTKLGGQVPPEVQQVLQLTPLNFARQFDAPFLLTDSAGDVARMLGKLTNVTLLFGAAREANRRRLALNAQLGAAKDHLARLVGEVDRFRGLQSRQQAVTAAIEANARLEGIIEHRDALQSLLSQIQGLKIIADQAEASAAQVTIPDTSRLDALVARWQDLRELLGGYYTLLDQSARWDERVAQLRERLDSLQAERRDKLAAAGICPTCGQEIPN